MSCNYDTDFFLMLFVFITAVMFVIFLFCSLIAVMYLQVTSSDGKHLIFGMKEHEYKQRVNKKSHTKFDE